MPVVNALWKNPSTDDGALAALAAQQHLAVEGEHRRREVGRRIGVGQRPADGAAVADLDVADRLDAVAQQREGGHAGRRGRAAGGRSSAHR